MVYRGVPGRHTVRLVDSIIEDLYKIHIPVEQLLSGNVTEQDVYSLSTRVSSLRSETIKFREIRWQVYQAILEFARKIHFHEMNGERASSWSQKKWNVLRELWDEALKEGYCAPDRASEDEEKLLDRLRLRLQAGGVVNKLQS